MKWECGKFGKNYSKLTIVNLPFLEICLLKCCLGNVIEQHVDKSEKRQYKLQINIIKAKDGGNFCCDNYILNTKFLKIYRADRASHGVDKVIKGKRLDLIIGINI